MPFQFKESKIQGVLVITPRVYEDGRGFLMESYRRADFQAAGIPEIVQENHSRSTQGSLRGLHYQRAPHAQGKLVRVVAGAVFDVAVDLRRGSTSYGQWHALTLSADNRHMVYLPPWCAHGFCVLSDFADVVYKTTAEYHPELEGGIIWNDPDLGIDWPLEAPLLSERDSMLPRLADTEPGF